MSERRTTTGLRKADTRSGSGPKRESRGRGPSNALRVCASPPMDWTSPLPSVPIVGPLQLGRDAALTLRDGRVSRVHCVVSPRRAGDVVCDLRSRNGTRRNGTALEPEVEVPLKLGDVLRVGDSVLVYSRHAGWPEPLPEPMRGTSAALEAVGRTVRRLAPTDLSVLLRGETGAGKEIVAEALHRASGRVGAFVAVNAGALPAGLVESELFGHVKGAFTGASSAAPGLIQSASRGTLFLDEIAELPLPIQAKLLRVLDTRRVRAVGATTEVAVDVRVVAATNADLEAAVAKGAFRADLLARLAEESVVLPPLRDRVEDVPVLLYAFLLEAGADPRPCSASMLEGLLRHRWPGNVRELRALARRLATLTLPDGEPFDVAHVGLPADAAAVARSGDTRPPTVSPGPSKTVRRHRAAAVAQEALGEDGPEGDRLRRLLAEHQGNVRRIAVALGKDRRQVYRWLRRAGLEPELFRPR